MVDTDNPEKWERVASTPTIDVRSVRKLGIITLASFTYLVAYDNKGLLWKTKQLSWDNLKVV